MKARTKIILIAIAIVVALAVVAFVVFDQRLFQTTSTERLPDSYTPPIEQIHSSVDKDNDGIDDQVDILQGALDYVATRPKYKSKYYAETGYPNDGFGVCTDVVANATRAAGYDLMQLVQDDIAAAPEAYDIDAPDPAIDFRRVRNLRVYFDRHAVKLTTDTSALEEWQGGDIVLFGDHIGVVSDRRNANGVPYVIHHVSPLQASYEEDILDARGDLTEHYRISE